MRLAVRLRLRLRLPDGSTTTLSPGDVIGCMASVALGLDDGRVPEAHAMVSLRGAELHLLSRPGVVAVDGRPSSKLALATGQRPQSATGLELRGGAVVLPTSLPALSWVGLTTSPVWEGAPSGSRRSRRSVQGATRPGPRAGSGVRSS